MKRLYSVLKPAGLSVKPANSALEEFEPVAVLSIEHGPTRQK